MPPPEHAVILATDIAGEILAAPVSCQTHLPINAELESAAADTFALSMMLPLPFRYLYALFLRFSDTLHATMPQPRLLSRNGARFMPPCLCFADRFF